MANVTALTTLPDRAAAEALCDALDTLTPSPIGTGLFEIEDGSGLWEVGGYFDETPDTTALALLAAVHGAAPFAVSDLPDVDWVAHVKRELRPVEAGRFFVYGSHDADKVPAGRIALLIEAAMAFGTGHHGTTLGCLMAIDRLATSGFAPARIADIGCGTAVLAMAAASVWPGQVVLASDIDTQAVEVAAANVAGNGLAGRVQCIEAAGFSHPVLRAGAPYDLVIANILMSPLIELAPEMAAHVAPGGRVILSGLLNTQADAVTKSYENVGFTPESRDETGDWTTLLLVRA